MQKTANEIKSSFELLASGHYQIHSFLYAQEFEQQAYENLIYPLMLVYPLGGSLSGTSYTRNYRVVIADRVLKSEGNELEVESDTQLIALDTLAYWMKLGTNERFSISSSNTITPFWEKWGDEVTGHFVDIGIEEFYDFNSCAIPLSGSIPTPPNPCKDARISVNSVVYGNAPSDTNFNVVVKDQLGALVGSLIGGEWIVNTGGSCADATYTIEDSLGNVLYTGTIPSGGSLTQAISNSTLNVNKSDGTLISSRSILAEGTDSYNVGDSSAVLKDESGNVLSTTPIKATESKDIVAPNGDVSVNSVAFDDVLSGGTLNIQVRKSTGNDLIGSKQGQYWRIGDSTAVIKDSANNTLKSEAIMATETENIVINNSLVNVRKSDNVLINAVSVKAENTENYLVADSSITNAAVSPTYSQLVKATEGLILPTQSIQNNGVASGFIPSVGTINVTTNAAPTSFTITGRTIDIVVPSGSTPMNVDFSADKLTASIGENITFTDLSDQSPTHWNWQFNDGTTSIVQNPIKNFLTLGFKNVTLLAGKIGAGGVSIKNNYIEIIGDADATAFLLATGITDTNIVTAINQLVVDLKSASIWTKLKAIYPMVGGTATTHKFNLKDPRDLDAAFRLGFNGGWTHSANGALPNGSNAFANTFFNPVAQSSVQNNFHLSAYIRNNPTPSLFNYLMGNFDNLNNATKGTFLISRYLTNNRFLGIANNGYTTSNSSTDARGFSCGVINGTTTQIYYLNGSNVLSGTSSQSGFSNSNIYIGAANDLGGSIGYSNNENALASIGDGLTSTDALNYYNAVQAFQTTLSRQV
jgi:PKD repeat protein